MCLAVPMEIKEIENNVAKVEMAGVKREVRVDICDEEPQVGDFVIVHAGFAIRRLSREEGLETIKLLQEGLSLELIS